MPISIKIMGCGRAIRIWPEILGYRATTISAKARPLRPCRTKPASTARSRSTSSFIRRIADAYVVDTTADPKEPVAGAPYSLQVCDAPTTMARAECEKARQFKLSADYYKGDRSMRESGFDVSFRFGPFGSGNASLCAGLPEQLALQNGKRSGADQRLAGPRRRCEKME